MVKLGHDVMNKLNRGGHESIGSDITATYVGVVDGSTVITMPYVGLHITDKESVEKITAEIKSDTVMYYLYRLGVWLESKELPQDND